MSNKATPRTYLRAAEATPFADIHQRYRFYGGAIAIARNGNELRKILSLINQLEALREVDNEYEKRQQKS